MRKDISEADVRSAVEKFPLSMKKAAEYLDIPYRTFIERAKKYGAYKPNPSGLGTDRNNAIRDKFSFSRGNTSRFAPYISSRNTEKTVSERRNS